MIHGCVEAAVALALSFVQTICDSGTPVLSSVMCEGLCVRRSRSGGSPRT